MPSELELLEDAIRSIWKVMGKERVMTETGLFGEGSEQGITLLLLTDEEIEQLCQHHAKVVFDVTWFIEVGGNYSYSWSLERSRAQQRLNHFAEVWNEDRVQSILDEVFKDYDPDKERAELEAWMQERDGLEAQTKEEEERCRQERDMQKREGPPSEESPREEPEPMFDGPPF